MIVYRFELQHVAIVTIRGEWLMVSSDACRMSIDVAFFRVAGIWAFVTIPVHLVRFLFCRIFLFFHFFSFCYAFCNVYRNTIAYTNTLKDQERNSEMKNESQNQRESQICCHLFKFFSFQLVEK